MKTHVLVARGLLVIALGLSGAIGWRAVWSQDDGGAEPAKNPKNVKLIATGELGGEDRYLAFADSDKPLYRPGETVYFRAAVLHHATHAPLPADRQVFTSVELRGPKGDVVASGGMPTVDSIVAFSWPVPEELPGGEYTMKFTFPGNGFPPAERKFDVRAYRAPRLKSQIKFLRDGYGPGDEVAATLQVERAEGGVPAGAQVTVIARVDNQEVYRGQTTVQSNGAATARFPLPVDIRRGEGTLAMVIEDGGVVETASKTIPILLQTIDLSMYPEGGDLLAGLPSRIYFEAFTPAKKPADLAGVVIDAKGAEVAQFKSEHEGRGRFEFTPQAGMAYSLKITQPSGIRTTYRLPEVKNAGAALRSAADLFAADKPLQLQVAAAQSQALTLTLAQRENVLATIELPASELADHTWKTVPITLDVPNHGVLTATVWDQQGQPLAERLVYRQPAQAVQVNLSADSSSYTPGGKTQITVTTTNAAGEPVSAMVGLNVTDDSVLEMIDKRDQRPRLPAMVLLEGEVRDLADAHVYLDSTNPQAPAAVDLLLGTQGWRRFALVNLQEFLAQHGDDARRVAALQLVTRRERFKHFPPGAPFPGEAVRRFAFNGPAAPPKPQAAIPLPVAPAPADDAIPAEAARLPVGQVQPVRQLQAAQNGEAKNELKEAEEAQAGARPANARQGFAAAAPVLSKEQSALRDALDDRIEVDALFAQKPGREPMMRNDFVAVREFAHAVRPGRIAGERTDFAETLFWHAGVKTDEHGKATISFDLNDSVTSFRVAADAFSADGALGAGTLQIESVEPFYLEPKMPLEVTAGDLIRLPVGVVNATDAALGQSQFAADTHLALDIISPQAPFTLAAGERIRQLLEIAVQPHNGPANFTLSATAGPYADKVTRSVTVRPQGFPLADGQGGLLGPGETATFTVNIPADIVPRSLTAKAVVYPTPLASMTQALEALIREPCGCFEQTSSSVYPLVMAQQYFMSHQGVDPALIERSADILDRGYARLLGFESKSGGFEWFGGDPGHDALTAYGLMEFRDMAEVRQVDADMLARTTKWLLAQRDGKGGFERKTHTLHTWVAEPECSIGYNTWALLSADVDADLSTEVKAVRELAEKSQNSYAVALAANVLGLAGDKDGSNHLLDKLAGYQQADGSLSGATQSVVGSGGEALQIETTSLATLAWLGNPHYIENVERSIQYLAESCKSGRFGSTQSTILALKAIVAYDASRAKPKAPGSLQLVIDGEPIGDAVSFTADTTGAIELPLSAAVLAQLSQAGEHNVQVRMQDGSQMPYSMSVNYNRLTPASAEKCALHLEVKLVDDKVEEGAVTEAQVTIVNRTNETVPTPLAIIGAPGGLEVRHDQLKELVKQGKIAAYEVIGREVVLYWRALEAEERVDLPLSFVAAVPGVYTGPASRAYLYYTDEHKQWVDGLKVEITAK
ncbi:MG2 domain-containing protein [Lignipirellula cremea]|uniref:A-macroglobulin complement component n=1 Tax=Lignipirellula cremea TaxID=2528010 RepID=A0A518DPQ1_9BACT|nr:MG2 domain-containing protein [Lignipirellula cremea]QDU93820.1 A-macroglobulin complement component [Lignipirellula cremea]